MTLDELKPCPFCGGKAEHDGQRAYIPFGQPRGITMSNAVVYCTQCEAEVEKLKAQIAAQQINEADLIATAALVGAGKAGEEVKRLEAENERLREALRPFAEVPYVGRAFNRAHLSEWDFRKARAAMEAKNDE